MENAVFPFYFDDLCVEIGMSNSITLIHIFQSFQVSSFEFPGKYRKTIFVLFVARLGAIIVVSIDRCNESEAS